MVRPTLTRTMAAAPLTVSPMHRQVVADDASDTPARLRGHGTPGQSLDPGADTSSISGQAEEEECATGAHVVHDVPHLRCESPHLPGSQREALSTHFDLTETGRLLLRRVEAIIADAYDAEEAARASEGRMRGTLRVDCSALLAELALERVVHEYLARHPALAVQLHVATERVDLRAERVDIAFRTGPLPDQSGLRCRLLARSLTPMFASTEYLAMRGVPRTARELAEHDCIVIGGSQSWALRDGATPLRARLRVNGFAPAKRAALAGIGIARCAAAYVGPELATGRLHVVLPEQTTLASVYAVMPGGGPIAAKVRGLLELARVHVTTESLCPPSLRPLLRTLLA